MASFINKYGDEIHYSDDIKTKEAVIDWCKEHQAFCGETIQQSDEPYIDASNLLSYIVDDIVEFERKE